MPAQGHDEARIVGYLEVELPQHSWRTFYPYVSKGLKMCTLCIGYHTSTDLP